MGSLLFWMQDSPHPDIVEFDWLRFLDFAGAVFVVSILLGAAIIAGLYSFAARKLKIHSPEDVFRPYTPLKFLLLAPVAGLLAAAVCWQSYESILGAGAQGGFSAAAGIFFVTTFLAMILAYLAILIPGVTPPKFRYRPIAFLKRSRAV